MSPAPLVTATASADYSLTPSDIRRAYSLPRTGAAHQTIAIVSAYDDPSAEADLNAYTKRFGIPSCTVPNGCFRKLNQDGQASPLPGPDPTGGVFLTESSVGIEAARGVCQSCAIILVEARSASKFDLSSSAGSAARVGATVAVTAFEEGQAPDDSQYAGDYSHPGTAVVAASGDDGYTGQVYFPSLLPGVVAVGGTHLDLTAAGGYRDETAWASSTSGCSAYDNAAAWQASPAASVGCGGRRSIADVAAVAEPGLLVHVQGAGSPCGPAWCEADGTSVAAPIIAGMIGLAGSAGSAEQRLLYAHAGADPGALRDIRSGATSSTCNGAPICQARPGYDGPTGFGTPYGLAAFLQSGGAVDRRHPRVQLSAPRNRLRVGSRWTTRLGLSNGNPFAIHGSIALSRRLRVGGRARTVRFAGAGFRLAPLGSANQTLAIAKGTRTLLKRLRSVTVTVAVRVSGPAAAAAHS